jgi:hypothetical protein
VRAAAITDYDEATVVANEPEECAGHENEAFVVESVVQDEVEEEEVRCEEDEEGRQFVLKADNEEKEVETQAAMLPSQREAPLTVIFKAPVMARTPALMPAATIMTPPIVCRAPALTITPAATVTTPELMMTATRSTVASATPPDVTPEGKRNLQAELLALKNELCLMQRDLLGREAALGIGTAETLERKEKVGPLGVDSDIQSQMEAPKVAGSVKTRRRCTPRRSAAEIATEERDARSWEEVVAARTVIQTHTHTHFITKALKHPGTIFTSDAHVFSPCRL